MTGEEVRKLTDTEIKNEVKTLRAQFYQLRTQAVTEKVEDVSRFGKIRKDIARLITERTNRLKAKNGKPAPKPAEVKAPAKKAPAAKAPAKRTAAKPDAAPSVKPKAPRKTKASA